MTGKDEFPADPLSIVPDIPLYLIPRVVADQINEKRDQVSRIVITRTRWHYYTVMVLTSEEMKARDSVPSSLQSAGQQTSDREVASVP
jgi:hypothetical protein